MSLLGITKRKATATIHKGRIYLEIPFSIKLHNSVLIQTKENVREDAQCAINLAESRSEEYEDENRNMYMRECSWSHARNVACLAATETAPVSDETGVAVCVTYLAAMLTALMSVEKYNNPSLARRLSLRL